MTFEQWRERFSKQYKQYIEELGDVGLQTAQSTFDSAPPQYGNGKVSVSKEYDGSTDFRIVASGHDAAFIEFGTGVGVTVNPTFHIQSSFPIEEGSWSKENDGMFSRLGYWYYNDIRMEGTPALGGMQQACIEMQNNSTDIAKRVFG